MRFEIAGQDEKDAEPVVRLKLKREGTSVVVVAVDDAGRPLMRGCLVEFTSNGYVRRRLSVNDVSLGFKLDDRGRIKEGF